MKKLLIVSLMLALCAGSLGCTNLNRTQQGVLSGAAVGALAGVGIASLAGGSGTIGALVGGAAGGVAGGAYGAGYLNNGGF